MLKLPSPPIRMMELVRYDAMCRAIAEAHAVDEVKDIRDKAIALETYARLACDTDNEQRAHEIRVRAERRCGQLLKEMDKAQGAREPGTDRGTTRSTDATASGRKLADLGISKDQSSRWQRLADIPEPTFEGSIADGVSTSAMIARPTVQPVEGEALWLWGRLRDFEKHDISEPPLLERSPADVMKSLPAEMLEDIHLLAPRIAAWLSQIGGSP
jgi:hypothetical protein